MRFDVELGRKAINYFTNKVMGLVKKIWDYLVDNGRYVQIDVIEMECQHYLGALISTCMYQGKYIPRVVYDMFNMLGLDMKQFNRGRVMSYVG